MHRVDRGPEPNRLGPIRDRYTLGWIRHYSCGVGEVPNDARWRDFYIELEMVFKGLCAYCEEIDKGEVDHFRPKSRNPELAYKWSNWLFACRACNSAKGEKWPSSGYVDPCTNSYPDRPELFFDFDVITGHIVPKSGISERDYFRASTMVRDLKLNALHHLKKRLRWLEDALPLVFLPNPDAPPLLLEKFRARAISRDAEFSSLTRAWLSQRTKSPTNER